MKIYSYSEARQRLASVLEEAGKDGAARIRRRDGRMFLIKPERPSGSPLDVKGVKLEVTTSEIVNFVRESREGRRFRGGHEESHREGAKSGAARRRR